MKTPKDLQFYLAADRFALGRQGIPKLFGDEIWKFQIALRKCEYYKTKPAPFRPLYLFWKLKKRRLGLKLGFEIPEFVFGAGLRINHCGNLIVSKGAFVGRWCDIHQGVNIGASNPEQRLPCTNYSPAIGDHAWIGPGAKIFGPITIGRCVQIGANAVVGKSFGDDVTLGGVPAKIIRQSGTAQVDVAANPNRAEEFFKLHPEFQSYQNHTPRENQPMKHAAPNEQSAWKTLLSKEIISDSSAFAATLFLIGIFATVFALSLCAHFDMPTESDYTRPNSHIAYFGLH